MKRKMPATYAAWGYDYLKYDWCSYSRVAGANPPHAEHVKPYALMGRLLREQKRDILFSLCQYGNDHVERWGPSIKGTSWRTTGDIIDTWSSLTSIIDLQLHTSPLMLALADTMIPICWLLDGLGGAADCIRPI